jgi:hypothetical protein
MKMNLCEQPIKINQRGVDYQRKLAEIFSRLKVVDLGRLSTSPNIGCIFDLVGGLSSSGWLKITLT